MVGIVKSGGTSSNREDSYNPKSSSWEQILFDLDLKISKSVFLMGINGDQESYYMAIDHFEDHLRPYINERFDKEFKEEKRKLITLVLEDEEMELTEFKLDNPERYKLILARAKFRALRMLMSRIYDRTGMPKKYYEDVVRSTKK